MIPLLPAGSKFDALLKYDTKAGFSKLIMPIIINPIPPASG
jgi:hypothetical protein